MSLIAKIAEALGLQTTGILAEALGSQSPPPPVHELSEQARARISEGEALRTGVIQTAPLLQRTGQTKPLPQRPLTPQAKMQELLGNGNRPVATHSLLPLPAKHTAPTTTCWPGSFRSLDPADDKGTRHAAKL